MQNLKVDSVPSGSFEIGRNSDRILRAFLGSCVGVGIIDKQSGIAGLLHILLPEPPAKAAVVEPEKYASTAIPLFISKLLESGAKIDQMQAVVAGGSLVGHVSMMDLKLDIGGQSAEIVENYLKVENIAVEKVETGGYLSTQISVNLHTMECTIEPILDIHPSYGEAVESNEPFDLQKALQHIRPIPQIALKVIRLIHSESKTMSSIAAEIRQDQVLAARVLQLSNSAYINPGKMVESIDKALILLGEKRIFLLTLSVFTEMFYQQSDTGYSLIKGGMYRHGMEVSFLAEKLARFTGLVEADLAFTAGLLHDIGKTALDQSLASEYPLFYRKMLQNSTSALTDIEKELFGYSHDEIGGKLAETWSLPESLCEVITLHHTPGEAKIAPQLTHLIALANALSHSFSGGATISKNPNWDISATYNALNMTNESVKQFIDSIDWKELDSIQLVNSQE